MILLLLFFLASSAEIIYTFQKTTGVLAMVPITMVYLLLALLLALQLHPLFLLLLQQQLITATKGQGSPPSIAGIGSKFKAPLSNMSWSRSPPHSAVPSSKPNSRRSTSSIQHELIPPLSTNPHRARQKDLTKPHVHVEESLAFHGSASFRPSRASMADARFWNASRLIIVDQFGFGHFQSIQAAVNSIPVNNTRFYTILVAGGLFEEKVIIPHDKPFIKLQGLGSEDTVISWHDTAATFAVSNPQRIPGRPLGTFHSATVAVNAPNFIARGMTFQNTAPAPASGVPGGQAVAFQVSGDQAAFYDCKFRGRQDTLYDHKGRHYFKNCYIEGSIDFIFGDGLSLYKACRIHAVGSGFITAQKRQNESDDTGFSFVECELTGSSASIELYLGRAWGPFSRVVYASCYMDAIIVPQGWHNWGDASRQLTVSYSEFNCSGPGAKTLQRVPWAHQLDSSEAASFINISFVQGDQWLPYE